MKKKILSLVLSLVMALSLLPISVSAATEFKASPINSDYFYEQLNSRAQQIYKLMLEKFQENSEAVLNGTLVIELTGEGNIATDEDVKEYLAGNKDLYNDFCAAKDALDLDHSELWWLDSGYMSFRATEENSVKSISIGPGRGKNYLLAGQEISHTSSKTHPTPVGVEEMKDEVEDIIQDIVDTAVREANASAGSGNYSDVDTKAAVVRSVHDQIVRKISYRYETECLDGSDNAKYIRTLYALATHEGVCESYARAMQVCLTRLGIECVLVHGVQSKGTPEDHMWNLVNIPEGNVDHWYAVDATWDDPLTADWYGRRDLAWTGGDDGKENGTYFLVGQSVIGEYWHPSGYVSTGNFEFKYPTIETSSFSGATAFDGSNGLKVMYSAGSGSMEEGTPAGVFVITFQGMNQRKAAEKGFYFLLKMYDYHPDGTYDIMQDWYYAAATLAVVGDSDYFYDTEDGLKVYTGTCEYVDVAVTTCKPEHYDIWTQDNKQFGQYWQEGYFQGADSDIIAQSGMLYNTNSSYEAPPYVLSQFPAPNGNCTAGYDYRFRVTYDDNLIHPQSDVPASIDNFVDNSTQAAQQRVRVRYTTNQQDLHSGGVKTVQIAGDLPFDKNRDGYVDMPGDACYDPSTVDFKWIYPEDCPNSKGDEGHICSVDNGCPIIGVEFNFRASDLWIDDITEFCFSIEGVVGSRSNKYPNDFSVISMVPGLCPACYRSQGIDWNLWGQPTLLDAPENLDLYQMAKDGGTDPETLAKLDAEMNKDDLNGRLMLVVEDKSKGNGNREEFEKINEKMEEAANLTDSDILASSVFEINFNRICPMVKLKPNKNQSLRVQVGYPAGVTYESLGKGTVELKAYHFTRCSADDGYDCGRSEEKGHKWGDDIISVEQIDIIPTPYGMVLMCSAFSPIEIVAVKKTGGETATETQHNVVVVSDMNGKVQIGGVDAIGDAGNRKVDNNGSLSFTAVPDTGYSVDTVSFGGVELTPNEDGTYTLSNVTKSDVLNVTFLPTEIKEKEEEQGIKTVVAKVCEHKSTHETQHEVAPGCTMPGKTAELTCDDCGMVVQKQTEIPATGHSPRVDIVGTPADCENAGSRDKTVCSVCGAVLSDGGILQPIGHHFAIYELQDETTCQGTAKVAKCENPNCDATHTIYDTENAADHDFSVETGHTDATCSSNATVTYECRWCGLSKTDEVDGTKLTHIPNSTGHCTLCGEFLCAEKHTLRKLEAKAPTCTESGLSEGWECSVCGSVITPQDIVPATGHKFPETMHKGDKCEVCGQELLSDTHTPVPMESVPATCDTPGTMGGEQCSGCGEITTQPTTIPALGHEWQVEGAQWTWSTDGLYHASVTLICSRDPNHTGTFEATVEEETTEEATCKTEGKATYTATYQIPGGETVTDVKADAVLPKTEHSFGAPTVTKATCAHHGTKTWECEICGQTVVEVSEDPLPAHKMVPDPKKSTPATCTEPGMAVSTCSVCHYEESTEISATGHSYENGTCIICGAVDPNTPSTPSTPSIPSGNTTTSTDADGTRTMTTTHLDGSVTETKTTANGVVGRTEIDKDGKLTSASVTVPASSGGKGIVTAPIEVEDVKDVTAAPKIGVEVRGGNAVKVEIPVTETTPGTVAVLVHEDGTEEIVRDCALGEEGVVLKVEGNVTLKIVDNSRSFDDVQTVSHWASNAIEFGAARELFAGTGDNKFSPDATMTRGMLVTVLHHLEYDPETVGGDFTDVAPDTYYTDSVAWAQTTGIVSGYGDGSFKPNDYVTREQLVTILYNYAEKKGYVTENHGSLSGYADAENVSGWAVEAMNWAVDAGLVHGIDGTHLVPNEDSTRAEVATIIMLFCEKII